MTREENPQKGEMEEEEGNRQKRGKKGVGNEVDIGPGYMVVVVVVL